MGNRTHIQTHLINGDVGNDNGVVSRASGTETRINSFDANGRLLHQRVLKSDNSVKYEID